MALGRRKREQQELWVATSQLAKSPGHPFYRKLNQLLDDAGFDAWVEKLCEPYYAENGRPSIPPGVYFRMIFIGYFEGIGSQRGIAWRCSDSRSIADFLGVPPTESAPDHSSMTKVHQRLPQQVHEEVFRFVLRLARANHLLDGKTVAVDSTTLEANAAMKSIERRDSGEDWTEYLQRLAQQAGIENPTAAELRRFDKSREDKTVSNAEWQSTSDADSRIAKMKDGTTHLAYKAEHAVDTKTDLVLAATVYRADQADTATLVDSVMEAQLNIEQSGSDAEIRDVVADKGYHAAATLELADGQSLRSYVPEPQRRQSWNWRKRSAAEREAVLANRRRVRGKRSKRLQRLRSELTERSFAHVCETGGARRSWLRGLVKVTKRYLIQVAARNLGLVMRKLFGIGTPKSLQAEGELFCVVYLAIRMLWSRQKVTTIAKSRTITIRVNLNRCLTSSTEAIEQRPFSTGC